MNRDDKLEWIRRCFYKNSEDVSWFDRVTRYIRPNSHVLDIGAGSGRGHQNQRSPKGNCARAIGIDLDPRVLDNPNFDLTYRVSAYDLPDIFGAEFDVIYSTMVAEHIDDPDAFIRAQLAIIRPGGILVHHTVSKFYYTSFVNNLFPIKIKNWLIRSLGSGRDSGDIFKAHYMLNSVGQIQSLAKKYDLDAEVYRYSAPPGYLRRSILLMLAYVAIDKPLSAIFPCVKPGFVFILRRPQDAAN